MHAAHLSIRFMYSFVLKHSAISDIINNLDGLALARVPRPTNGFRHLLTLRRTEAVAEPALKDGTRRPATVVTLSVPVPRTKPRGRRKRLTVPDVALQRRFYFDRSGACTYVLDLSCPAKNLSTENIVAITSAADAIDTTLSIVSPQRQRTRDPWKALPERREGDTGVFELLYRQDVSHLLRMDPRGYTKGDWLDCPRSATPGQPPIVLSQAPWVMSILQFADQDAYIDFLPHDGSFDKRSRYHQRDRLRQFGALLFRWMLPGTAGWHDVDTTYLDRPSDPTSPCAINMHVHRDIYIGCCIRSCLVACNVSPEARDG
jgi:hypothetical protein